MRWAASGPLPLVTIPAEEHGHGLQLGWQGPGVLPPRGLTIRARFTDISQQAHKRMVTPRSKDTSDLAARPARRDHPLKRSIISEISYSDHVDAATDTWHSRSLLQ